MLTRRFSEIPCLHLDQIQIWEPNVGICQECVDLGGNWPSLHMCLICGYVGCCDTSKNKHMERHIKENGQSLIRSIEPGEGCIWCYPGDIFISANSAQLDEQIPVQGR